MRGESWIRGESVAFDVETPLREIEAAFRFGVRHLATDLSGGLLLLAFRNAPGPREGIVPSDVVASTL